MLNKIRDALIELDGFSDDNVFYGVAKETDATKNIWNYIVFSRKNIKMNANKNSYTYTYDVSIIQEDYVPETMVHEVINKLYEIGLRISEDEVNFEYVEKADGKTVEILTMNFNAPRKSCYGTI